MAEKQTQKKKSFFSVLDQAIGDDGIKTDLKITITPGTAWRLGAVIVGSIVIGGIALEFVKGFLNATKSN